MYIYIQLIVGRSDKSMESCFQLHATVIMVSLLNEKKVVYAEDRRKFKNYAQWQSKEEWK